MFCKICKWQIQIQNEYICIAVLLDRYIFEMNLWYFPSFTIRYGYIMWCCTCNWRVEWVLPEALRLTCSKNSLAIDVIYSLNRSWGMQKLFAYNIFFWHFLPSNYSLTWYCPSAKGSNTLWYGRKLNHNWICIIGRATHNEDNRYNCSDIYN